jgi:hypothetical protein
MVFLPIALTFGILSADCGVQTAGWMLATVTALAAALLIRSSIDQRSQPSGAISDGQAEPVRT